MLLEIDEIATRLETEFLHLEPLVTGLTLKPANASNEKLGQAESILGEFSAPYKTLLAQYDLFGFNLGPVAFIGLDLLLFYNGKSENPLDTPWWGREEDDRPQNFIFFADSDNLAFILNNQSDEVFSFRHGERWWEHKELLASDFRLFLRGAGTVFFRRMEVADKDELAREVAALVGADSRAHFWKWLAE